MINQEDGVAMNKQNEDFQEPPSKKAKADEAIRSLSLLKEEPDDTNFHKYQPKDMEDVATLKRKLEETRSALEKETQEYFEAKLNESSANQTVSSLTTNRQEQKHQLRRTKDELEIAKADQQEAAAIALAKESKKDIHQAEYNSLLAKLLEHAQADGGGQAFAPRRAPKLEAKIPVPPANLEFKIPRRPPSSDASRDVPPEKTSKKPKKNKRLTQQGLLDLSVDADANMNAKAKLIEIVTKAPLHELRQVMEIPTQMYTRALPSKLSLALMRVLVRGRVHLRGDLQERLQKDLPTKRWLLSGQGLVKTGHAMDETQARLIYVLDIPSSS